MPTRKRMPKRQLLFWNLRQSCRLFFPHLDWSNVVSKGNVLKNRKLSIDLQGSKKNLHLMTQTKCEPSSLSIGWSISELNLDAKRILVYPYGVPGAVNVTAGDLSRLQPDEFLNDTLIEFGFKWVTSFLRPQNQALIVLRVLLKELEATCPELVSQVYVFNSFFYKKLNKRKYACLLLSYSHTHMN